MAASKRANAIPPAFVARQSLNDEELVSVITLLYFTLDVTDYAVGFNQIDIVGWPTHLSVYAKDHSLLAFVFPAVVGTSYYERKYVSK